MLEADNSGRRGTDGRRRSLAVPTIAFAICLAIGFGGCGKAVELVDGPDRYVMVDELLAGDLADAAGQRLRVHGWVKAGSLETRVIAQRTERTFIVHKSGKQLRVFSTGPVPDTFRDQAEVVITGRLVAAASKAELAKNFAGAKIDLAYVLDATEIQAKCPTKYGDKDTKMPAVKYE